MGRPTCFMSKTFTSWRELDEITYREIKVDAHDIVKFVLLSLPYEPLGDDRNWVYKDKPLDTSDKYKFRAIFIQPVIDMNGNGDEE